jgi:hypothetical protein
MTTPFEIALMRLKPARPVVAGRRRRIQEYLLQARRKGCTVTGAIEALQTMRETRPAEYRKLVGSDRILANATIVKYWKSIPPWIREASRSSDD